MSNPKSKMPVARSYFDEANNHGGYQMDEYDHNRSWSSFSRNRANGQNEHDKILKERTKNGRFVPETYDSGERTVPQDTRRKSLRLSYDPEREPGGEYLVEKGDVDWDDQSRIPTNDSILNDSPSEQRGYADGYETEGPVPTFRSDTGPLHRPESENDSEKENVYIEAISDLDLSGVKSVSLGSFQESEPSDTPIPSSPARHYSVQSQLHESPLPAEYTEPQDVEPPDIEPEYVESEYAEPEYDERDYGEPYQEPVETPKPVFPSTPQYTDPGRVSVADPTPERDVTPEQLPERLFIPEPVHETPTRLELDLGDEDDTEPPVPLPESSTLANTLDSAKESTTSSLPPSNFKTTLFKRVRRVSTPRRTPSFTPRRDKTPNKTPVIDDLGSEQNYPDEEEASIYVNPSHTDFLKDSQIKNDQSRFQRHDSSDSIRDHYDPHIKREIQKVEEPKIKSFTRYEQVNVDTNARTSFKRPGRTPEVKRVESEHRSQSSVHGTPVPKPVSAKSKPDDTNKRESPVQQKMQVDTKQYENHLSILAKKSVPHNVPIQSVVPIKYEVKPTAKPPTPVVQEKIVKTKIEDAEEIFSQSEKNSEPPYTDVQANTLNTNIDDADDIFSEGEQRSKLKQPQYIADGLKLVKKKVHETEIVIKQAAKQAQESSKKRSVLKSLNTQRKQPTPQKSNLPTKLPRAAKKDTLKLLNVREHGGDSASESGYDPETQTEITDTTSVRLWNNRTKLLHRNRNRLRQRRPSIDTKSSIPTQSQFSLETLPPKSTTAWNPHPQPRLLPKTRVHRPSPIKRPPRKLSQLSKRSEKTFYVNPNTTKGTNSVEKWVAQAIKENTMNRDTLKLPKLPKIKRDMGEYGVRKKAKLKVRMPKRKKKHVDGEPNIINMGSYLPLPKLRRRAKPPLYTQVGKVKGYESEIPILYNSEEEDGYQDQRPNTVNERRRYPEYRRYEGDNDQVRVNYRDPAHRKVGRTTGALVRLFRNGDTDHRGCPLTINQKFKNFESLLQVLNDKIPTPTGIKHIFKWPEGREMKSVTDFQNRCVYIVSSTRTLRRDVNYGESREGYWSNKRPSAGKVRTQEVQLFKRPTSPKGSPKPSPFIVTIVHNLHRDRREKVILNPHTSQSFEEWLEDINNQDIPVRALYMDKAPFTQIRSFSHLFRELRNKTSFLACGDEYVPVELAKKRQAPGSNSSTESFQEQQQQRTGGPGGGRKKPPRHQDMDQIYENGRPDSPSTNTSMSRYDTGPLGGGGGPRGQAPALRPPPPPIDNRRGPRGAVHVEIDGVVREFWPPSYTDSEDDGTRPNQMLKCQWVYGFRGRDARHNLAVLPGSGELVYYVASIAVLYDKVKDVQRHYNKHNEEISCLTLHPNGYLIATGQLHGKEPEHSSHIRIWDSESLSTYSVIGLGVFYGGIISIGFSYQGTGNLMCALDGSSKHVLSVWRVSLDEKNRGDDSNYIIARTSTSTDPVHCACFYPADENNSILITYGAKHIYFWKIFFDATKKKEAKIFRDRCSGIFEEHCPKSVNCVAFLSNGDVVTGDSSGNLMVWDRDAGDAFTCKFVVNAHQGPIMSVVALKDGTILSGGGSEIKGWDSTQNFVCTSTRQMPSEVGGVRSIVTLKPGGEDGNMYIGTTRSCILEGAMGDKFNVLIQGHSDAIWGLVAHPYEPTFITAGSDAVVYKWSVVTHRVYWRSQIEAPCTSLAVDHHNELVALGTSEGTFVILNAFNGMHIATVQVGTETISCLAFSPNGMYLATGCNDGLITIFNVHDRGHTYVKASVSLRGHGSGVGHLDWSRDNNSLQSVANDNELIFWDLLNMKQNKTPMKTRDIEWFTNTCNVSYSLIGPWTNLDRNEQVKVVNRSRDRALVIVGDTVGRLRLYKYPCSRERADFRNVRVYSSEVTAVAFTPDSRTALTCGGRDAALMQWTVDEEL